MKRISGIFIALILAANFMFAGVIKKEKIAVNFGRFGTFSSLQSIKIEGAKKATDSESDFQGKSLLGRLTGGLALQTGSFGEIVDLAGKIIYNLDHKKKTYTEQAIEKFQGMTSGEQAQVQAQPEEQEESVVKIIRSDFKVDKTGSSKVINQFQCEEYTVSWITEWENTQTGEKGTNKLLTTVWTTPLSGDIKLCHDEERSFSQEFMTQMGMGTEDLQQQVLGTQWQAFFTQMDTSGQASGGDISRFADEMGKIQGYPVIVDGKYYATREGGEAAPEEETPGVKKMFGKLAKKVLTKKTEAKSEDQPSFAYYVELLECSPMKVEEDQFQVPTDYKKKNK